MQRGEQYGTRSERIAIADCREREGDTLLSRQKERRAAAFGELART
jgi:hypothetical protein